MFADDAVQAKQLHGTIQRLNIRKTLPFGAGGLLLGLVLGLTVLDGFVAGVSMGHLLAGAAVGLHRLASLRRSA